MKSFLILILGTVWAAAGALSPKIIDLTQPFDSLTEGYPGLKRFELNVTQNGTTDQGYWLQIEDYGANIHTGTHIDAPCHIKKGKWCLHEIPLQRFFAPASVVDITRRTSINPDANLEVEDLLTWESTNQRKLDGTVVLVNSGWGAKWNDTKAFIGTTDDDLSKVHFPGVSPKAARWLRDHRAVIGVGVDTTSLDNGQAKKRKAHEALFEANIYGLENVANVDKLPPAGAQLYVFPMKITNASGAPVRIIAVVP